MSPTSSANEDAAPSQRPWQSRQRGSIDVMVAILLAASMLGIVLTGFRITKDAFATIYTAFDRRDAAAMRCKGSLTELLEHGPSRLLLPHQRTATWRPCLPPRSDHAAPGRKRTWLPDAICAVAERANRSDLTIQELRCASH